VYPRPGFDALEKRLILCPYRQLIHDVQPAKSVYRLHHVGFSAVMYEGNSISKLQIQVVT
jgi:hypothetical protein